MIVVLSVINGFESELRNRFLNANSHILMYRYPDGMSQPQIYIDKLNKDFKKEIIGSSPFIHYETMIKRSGLIHSVLVRGFSPKQREPVQSIRSWVSPPEALDLLDQAVKDGPPPILVGEGVLSILNIKVGDTIEMISPTSANMNTLKQFSIVGVYHSGLKHYDTRLVAMSLREAQKFFGMGERVTGLEVGLVDPDESPEIAERIKEKYPVSVKEWQSFNKPLLEALNMERKVIFFVVCIVALVAGFNILTTLFVAVAQKQKEISLLRALGANGRQILVIFLKQGALFGIIGSLGGVVLAFTCSSLLKRYKFIDLPDPYYVTNLPVDFDWRVYICLSGFGILICIAAGILPALAAARVTPTDGIRGTGKAF
jgi:lipoprotein-releasing system permease protein